MKNLKINQLLVTGDALMKRVHADADAGTIPAHDALAAVTAWGHLRLRLLGIKLKPDTTAEDG